ncbi:Hypothetical protein, putative [Bodo saltans]|uniref:Uncharacterized protein n=1 Tax=Bodo saltans TaxID=75058 RepID=A0A0S4KI00_BODSA|nr:Hypothetical protein, putative [Bodo saltans]|eukprot:CUI15311.1 Hypothetical protein, putative [Bodo saltans]
MYRFLATTSRRSVMLGGGGGSFQLRRTLLTCNTSAAAVRRHPSPHHQSPSFATIRCVLNPLSHQTRSTVTLPISVLSSSLREDHLVAAVLNVLDNSDPLNKGLPITAIASELDDECLEHVQEYYGGIKAFLCERNHLFIVQQVPPHGRYVVRKHPSAVPPFAAVVSTSNPPESSKIGRTKKLPFSDCWNTAPLDRDLVEEHAAILQQQQQQSSSSESVTFQVPSTLTATPNSVQVCFAFPRKLAVLSHALASWLLQQSGIPVADEHEDVLNLLALRQVVIPHKSSLLAVAILTSSLAGFQPGEAYAGAMIVHDALNDPSFLQSPSAYILLISSHPTLQLENGVGFEATYAQSTLSSFLLDRRMEPQEYDAYRLARFVAVGSPTTLSDLVASASTVLAIETYPNDGIESEQSADAERNAMTSSSSLLSQLLQVLNVAIAFPQLFELTPTTVRFILDNRYLPAKDDFSKLTDEELETQIEERREKVKKANNRVRVQSYEEMRYFKRLLSMRQSLISACDPNVLAYWIYDALETVEEPPTTGMCVQLLPQEVQDRTNGRSKSFQKRYPHLFRIVSVPPNYLLHRVDWPTPIVVTDSEVVAMSEADLITIVLGAFLERKKARRSKPVYACSLAMHLPKNVKKRIQKDGGLEKFLLKHPECFKVNLPLLELVDGFLDL